MSTANGFDSIKAVKPSDVTKWREDHGLTKAGMAKLLGVHWMTISRWELEKRAIPPFLKAALAEYHRQLTEAKEKKEEKLKPIKMLKSA